MSWLTSVSTICSRAESPLARRREVSYWHPSDALIGIEKV